MREAGLATLWVGVGMAIGLVLWTAIRPGQATAKCASHTLHTELRLSSQTGELTLPARGTLTATDRGASFDLRLVLAREDTGSIGIVFDEGQFRE